MQITDINLISLVTSIFSIALAILAIALSLFFYKWTSSIENNIKENVRSLGQEIEGMIEFNKTFYGDTFTLMKEAYGDIRKHAWPEAKVSSEASEKEIERRIEQRIKSIKSDTDKQLADLIYRQKISEKKSKDLNMTIEEITEKLIEQSKDLEKQIRQTKLREDIIKCMKRDVWITSGYILNAMTKIGYNPIEVNSEIKRLKADGIIDWNREDGTWMIINEKGLEMRTTI